MSEISIVTAFFDIGRGNWTPDKGLPHYLQRSNDTYLERFSHLSKLENEIVIFTTNDLAPKIFEYRKDKGPTKVIIFPFLDIFKRELELISKVQKNPEYQSKINPSQQKNPEYWSPEYVLVNYLKSYFVNRSIDSGLVSGELVAWLDFGYCRSESILNNVKTWKYNFDKDKIHFFKIKDYTGTSIEQIIANNDVHITGPCIVGGRNKWPTLEKLMKKSFNKLIGQNLIDDDQTLLLMAYLEDPKLFELHSVSQTDWFVIFRNFNET